MPVAASWLLQVKEVGRIIVFIQGFMRFNKGPLKNTCKTRSTKIHEETIWSPKIIEIGSSRKWPKIVCIRMRLWKMSALGTSLIDMSKKHNLIETNTGQKSSEII